MCGPRPDLSLKILHVGTLSVEINYHCQPRYRQLVLLVLHLALYDLARDLKEELTKITGLIQRTHQLTQKLLFMNTVALQLMKLPLAIQVMVLHLLFSRMMG